MRCLASLVCVLALGVMPLVGCSETDGAGGSAGDGGGGGGGGTAGDGGADLCEGVMCEDTDCKTRGVCDANDGLCAYYGLAEDGTECDLPEGSGACLSGECRERCDGDEDCDDNSDCTDDICDTVHDACVFTPLPGTCGRDGCPIWACVFGDIEGFCSNGTCCADGACEERYCVNSSDCNDHVDCTDDVCGPTARCTNPALEDRILCAGGTCDAGECALNTLVIPCTEQGIRNAIAAGGGPYTFACDVRTTIRTEAEIEIDNDVILDGGGNLVVDGNHEHRVFRVGEGVVAELRSMDVTSGHSEKGHGISNAGTLNLIDVRVHDNYLGSGFTDCAGISNTGMMTLMDSVVRDNGVGQSGYGGGICNSGTAVLINTQVFGNDADRGAGIWNSGELTVTDSSVSRNWATGIPNLGIRANGAGIYNSGTMTLSRSAVIGNEAKDITPDPQLDDSCGGISNAGTATLSEVTVSDNFAGLNGGGICTRGEMTIVNSTLSKNLAARDGDEIYITAGRLTLTNSTIVEENTANGDAIFAVGDGVTIEAGGSLVQGSCQEDGDVVVWVSKGHNIESPGDTCGFDQATDQVNVTAEQLNLGPLQDNGGPTMTHALGAGVAIDVIPAVDCVDADDQPLTTDQRGEPRPETGGTLCDVGAFELQP